MKSDKKPVKLYNIHILTILEKPHRWYIHVGVKKFWQQNGILYIKEEKSVLRPRSIFRYGMKYIRELRVQEIKDSKKAHEIEENRLLAMYERQAEINAEEHRKQEIAYKRYLAKQKKRKL
jgi:hypothetical protein